MRLGCPGARVRSRAESPGGVGFLSALIFQPAQQSAQRCENDQNDKYGPVVPREQIHDVPTVVDPEISKDGEPNTAPHCQSGQELPSWIVHGARRQ